MEPKTIAYFLILIFFSIVFIQSGIDKVVDKKGNVIKLQLDVSCVTGDGQRNLPICLAVQR